MSGTGRHRAWGPKITRAAGLFYLSAGSFIQNRSAIRAKACSRRLLRTRRRASLSVRGQDYAEAGEIVALLGIEARSMGQLQFVGQAVIPRGAAHDVQLRFLIALLRLFGDDVGLGLAGDEVGI